MEIKIKKLNEEAIVPTYGTSGAACFDIYSTSETIIYRSTSKILSTGLSFEIPEDHVMLVFSRSGHAFKNDVRLANAVGVIDSDFRGEIKIKLTNDTDVDSFSNNANFNVSVGDRIAQAMIIPVKRVSFLQVDELDNTDRGDGGMGSTGS